MESCMPSVLLSSLKRVYCLHWTQRPLTHCLTYIYQRVSVHCSTVNLTAMIIMDVCSVAMIWMTHAVMQWLMNSQLGMSLTYLLTVSITSSKLVSCMGKTLHPSLPVPAVCCLLTLPNKVVSIAIPSCLVQQLLDRMWTQLQWESKVCRSNIIVHLICWKKWMVNSLLAAGAP